MKLTKIAFATSLLLGMTAQPLHAQIRTDGSVGPAAQTLAGPSYQIPQSLGRLAGANLFQSFQTFKLASGESATFTTDSAGIANVISRVTGGEASTILGQIRLVPFSGAPAFYFVNPAGVVFGQGASIDVPGAFIVSTANSLRFADGSRLHADLGQNSSFSTAAPEAFGFLGSTRATIAVRDQGVLAAASGQSTVLVGGDVLIDHGTLASSGEIRVAAVGSQATDVPLNTSVDPSTLSGYFVMQGGLIGSSSTSSRDAGAIRIAAGDIWLTDEASINTFTGANVTGKGADIELRASSSITLDGGANLSAKSTSAGNGGSISLSAPDITLDTGAYIDGGTQAGSSGRGGDVRVQASQSLWLDGEANIGASTSGSGNGGVVDVSAGAITLNGGAYLSNLAVSGTGNAGDLRVQTAGDLQMTGGAQLLVFTTAEGNAGHIQVNARNVVLDGASSIQNAALGTALTGDIVIQASGDVSLHGNSNIANVGLQGGRAGNVSVTSRNTTLDGGSFLTSGSLDDNGAGGNITLNSSAAITLASGAYMAANTYTDVDAGAITLHAQDISLSGGAGLSSTAVSGLGNAGSIELVASRRVDISGGSNISSFTSTPGHAGQIRISTGDFSLTGPGLIGTGSGQADSGAAGQIEITASGNLTVSNSGQIDSSSYSLLGPAGDITLKAGKQLLLDRAAISSRSALPEGSGSAGAIRIEAGTQLTLNHETTVSTSTQSGGNAGLISLKGANVLLDDADLVSLASPGSRGAAGTIEVQAQQGLQMINSVLSTTTRGSGAAGTVRLSAADIAISGASGGVTAAAAQGSGGQTGNLEITASHSFALSDGATLTIQNDATVANPGALTPTLLRVTAPRIDVQEAGIYAAASGNVSASRIELNAADSMRLVRSIVSTSANLGNGGPLSLNTGGLLWIENTQVATSVFGATGNGGDISVSADTLLLKTGFIQANTAAANASGGLVLIDVNALLASGSSLFVGGEEPLTFQFGAFGFNVIQAAAPTGVSGDITITSPVLDLTGSLVLLNAHMLEPGGLGRNPCQSRGGSSLALTGRGGLAPSARGLMSVQAAGTTTQAPAPYRLSLAGSLMGCQQ